MLQLLGNLALLGPLAALAALRWPALGHPRRLVPRALAAGASIELLQRVLPLGRVVSPVDALLNAAGVVVTGPVVARTPEHARSGGATPRSTPSTSRRGGVTADCPYPVEPAGADARAGLVADAGTSGAWTPAAR